MPTSSVLLIDGWRTDQQRRGLMPSTIHRRTTMIRGWCRWCDDHGTDWCQPTAEHVERFLDAKRIGARTRYTWLSALHCFYVWGVRAGHLPGDPTADIIRPKLRRTLPRPISDGDLAVAIDMAPAQVRAWLTLAAYGGLRCAEIAGIMRDDIMWDSGRLRVVGKGGKERVVPMHEEVVRVLEVWSMPRVNRPIFLRPCGAPWSPAMLSRDGNEYLHGLGIDATMHRLRHWFATQALRSSGNLRVAQELLGHSSPTTTAVYTALVDEDARTAVDGIRLLRPQASLFRA